MPRATVTGPPAAVTTGPDPQPVTGARPEPGHRPPSRSRPGGAVKRGVDLAFAVAALVVLLPALVLIALLVLVDSGRPVLFRQERVGRHGRTFAMWKFRTMVVDAEARLHALTDRNEARGPFFKMAADPRVTRVGRWLRASCLDELPQLVNVLRGQMSVVGPRPCLPAELAAEPRVFEWRVAQLPGMTGLWQVSGRSALDPAEGVRLDRYYAEHWSLALDLSIVWRTVGVVWRSCARSASPAVTTNAEGDVVLAAAVVVPAAAEDAGAGTGPAPVAGAGGV